MDTPIEDRKPSLSTIANLSDVVAAELDYIRNQGHVSIDPRWLALATTQFQTAFMSLRRSIHPNTANKL